MRAGTNDPVDVEAEADLEANEGVDEEVDIDVDADEHALGLPTDDSGTGHSPGTESESSDQEDEQMDTSGVDGEQRSTSTTSPSSSEHAFRKYERVGILKPDYDKHPIHALSDSSQSVHLLIERSRALHCPHLLQQESLHQIMRLHALRESLDGRRKSCSIVDDPGLSAHVDM